MLVMVVALVMCWWVLPKPSPPTDTGPRLPARSENTHAHGPCSK